MTIPSPRAGKRARIEIIPLIDIIFFLLATFVMVSMAMIKNQGIPVHLPVAATSTAQERKDYSSITVTAAGDYFFNQVPASLEEIVARLQELKSRDGDPRVFINGDEKAEFGKAIAVLDEVRKAGISKVAIETKRK